MLYSMPTRMHGSQFSNKWTKRTLKKTRDPEATNPYAIPAVDVHLMTLFLELWFLTPHKENSEEKYKSISIKKEKKKVWLVWITLNRMGKAFVTDTWDV